jgi:hypothetical protein
MESTTRLCAFCPNPATPLAQEHLWSAWIGRLFPQQRLTWTIVDPENFGVTRGQMESFDLKIEAVCGDCNHGWMSTLETEIQPLLSGVIRDGESMGFSKRDRAKLAAFTFKNAVIANYLNPAREPFFTRAARERFRLSKQIPPSVGAWFSALVAPTLTGLNFGYVLGLQTGDEYRVWDDLEIYVYTFAVGYLVLQLRAFRWANFVDRGRDLPRSLPQKPFWDDCSITFWPNFGRAVDLVRWPPPKCLTEETLSR